MARPDPAGPAGRLFRAARTTKWGEKAKQAASALKSEYEAGKRGDDAPAAPIWPSPKEQLEGLMSLLRSQRPESVDSEGDVVGADGTGSGAVIVVRGALPAGTGTGTSSATPATDEQTQQAADGVAAAAVDDEADAEAVSRALGGIDWADVRAATAERTSEAAKAMRSMADQVDWSKVQPVAARVSSALIAAVASGRLGIGGPLGPAVARAIVDQGGLGRKVGQQLDQTKAPLPPDFRDVIETTARDA